MIKVLSDWKDVGEAHIHLARAGLPRHVTPEKTWDLYQYYQLLQTAPRDSRIVDLGCGELHTLRLADAMGFRRLCGVDLRVPLRARLSQAVRMWRRRTLQTPFILRRMDITNLAFPDGTFDVAVSISTIEHGVGLVDFFAEASRILTDNGLLFITTDYWEEKIEVHPSFRAYGRPWTIFDRHDVEEMVDIARGKGLVLLEPSQLCLECNERCVAWGGKTYTFISMTFRRVR